MKEKFKTKCYHRYCDDTVGLAKSKAEAKVLLKEYDRMSSELGLVVKATSFIAPIQKNVYGKKRRKRQRGGKKNRLLGVSVHARKNAS